MYNVNTKVCKDIVRVQVFAVVVYIWLNIISSGWISTNSFNNFHILQDKIEGKRGRGKP